VRLSYADGDVTAGVQDGLANVRMGLPPGEFTGTFVPPDGAIPAPTSFVVDPGPNEVTWTLSRDFETVVGRVTDATTGQPIAGAQVSVAVDFHSIAWSSDDHRFVTSAPDGSFTILVSSRNVMLFVLRDGYVSTLVPAHAAGSVALAPGVSASDIRRKPAADAKPRPTTAPAEKSSPLTRR
jgi:hypothetical protein